MTAPCPNATAEYGDGRCGGAHLVALQTTNRTLAGRPVPCPSCWAATGYPPVPRHQRQALAWWTVALDRLVAHLDDPQPRLFEQQDQEAVDLYTAASRGLDEADVDEVLRTRWQAWMARERREVPA